MCNLGIFPKLLHLGKIKIPKKIGQNLAKIQQDSARFSTILAKFATFCKKSAKLSAVFNEKIEIGERFFSPHGFLGFWDSFPKRCKGVHCVDLGESFPTSIYLQNLALIQPRTSLFNFFIFSPALVI